MKLPAIPQLISRIGRRLVIYTVLFSSVITLLLTSLQLYRDYRLDVAQIGTEFEHISRTHLAALAGSLWATDRNGLQLQLNGIAHGRDIRHAAVRENERLWASSGEPVSDNALVHDYPITFEHRGKVLTIGTLSVTASLDGIYNRLIDRAIVVLLSNGVKTFVVALFILFLIHRFVIRHLLDVTANMSRRTIDDIGAPLRLDRRRLKAPDELDQMLEAGNWIRKQIQDSVLKLRQSEARYRELVKLNVDWVWEQDTEGRFTHTDFHESPLSDNPEYLKDERREDLPGAEPDSGSWDEYRETLREHRPIRDFGYSVLNSRGQRRHLRISGNPVFDDEGGFLGYRGTVKDDTEQFAAERREEQEHLRLVDAIESLNDGFILFDASDRILLVNQAYRKLAGMNDDVELTGKTYEALLRLVLARGLITVEGREEEWVALRLEQHRNPTGPYESQQSNGVWLRINHARTSEKGYASIFTDISAQKAVEQQLKRRLRQTAAVASIGQFAIGNENTDSILQHAVKLTAEALGAELAKVLELLPDKSGLRLKAGVGWRAGSVGNAIVGAGKTSQAGYTLLSSEPVIVRDLTTESRFQGPALLTQHGVTSGVSLIIGPAGAPWGVLGVHTRTLREFTNDDVSFIQSVANILAETIARLTAVEALGKNEARYRTLFDAIPVSIWIEDFSAVWREVDELRNDGVIDLDGYLREHPETLARYSNLIEVVEVNKHTLELYGARSAEELQKGYVYSASALDLLRQQLVGLSGETNSFRPEYSIEEPTLSGETIDVVVSVVTCAPEHPQLVICSVTDISKQKAMESEIAARADRLEALLRTSARVNEDIDLKQTLTSIAEEAAVLMDIEGAGFRMLDGTSLVTSGTYGIANHIMVRDKIKVGESLSGIVAQTGQMLSVPDIPEDKRIRPEHQQAANAHSIRAYLGVPLRYQNKITGVLNVYGKEQRSFDVDDVSLLQAFADHAAVAIENARLYDGIKHHAASLSTEITERQLAENALRESETLFEQAEKMANMGHWEWDEVENKLVSCSAQFAQINRMSMEETLKTYNTVNASMKNIHPADRGRFEQLVQEGAAQKRAVDHEYRIIHVNGDVRHIHELSIPIVDESGAFTRTIGTIQDITERKVMEQTLRQKEQQLDAIFEHSPAEIFLKDNKGRYVRSSREFERRFGVCNKDLIGKLPSDVHDERLAASSRAHDLDVLESGKPILREESTVFAGESVESNLLSLKFPIFDATGTVTGLGAVVTDVTELKRAEEALSRSEKQLRLLMDSLPISIGLIDSECRYRIVNKICADWYGRPSAEIVGKHVSEMLGEAQFEKRHPFRRSVLAGKPQAFDTRTTYPDGKTRDVHVNFVPQLDASGQVEGFYSMVMDISERKRAEEAILASEQRLRDILDTMFAFVGLISLDGDVIEANNAPLQAASLERKDVIGRPFADTYWWSYAPEVQAKVRETLRRAASGEIVRDDFLVRVGENEFITVDCTFAPLRNASGNVTQVVGSGVDVTERKLAEEALKSSEQRFRAIVEHAPFGIVLKDTEFRYFVANNRIAALAGVPKEAILGKTTDQVFSGDFMASGQDHDREVLATGQASEREEYLLNLGEQRVFLTSKFPIKDETGTIVSIGGIHIDITDRKAAERALTESDRTLKIALQTAQAGVWTWEVGTDTTTWSDENVRLMGYEPGEVEPSYDQWLASVHPDDRANAKRQVEQAVAARHDIDLEFRILCPGGEIRWIHDFGRILVDEQGEPTHAFGLQIDITRRKQVEINLRETERQLRERIEEREQLSRDLHDGIVQTIYAIGLGLEDVKVVAMADPGAVVKKLSESIENLNAVIREVRKHITGLEPSVLSSRQIREELKDLTRIVVATRRIGFKLDVDDRAVSRLPAEAASDVINIAREALSNALRHSNGSNGLLSLRLFDRKVRLVVEDDGIGFNPKANRAKGHGLENIASRAARLSGQLDVTSGGGRGTRITLDIPTESACSAG